MWRKLGTAALFSVLLQGCSKPTLEVDALVYEPAKVVKPFKLKNQHGNDVGVDDLKSQWDLLFLGYTSCPDVCPMTLAKLRQVEKKLAVEDINVWFISVDPNRDTAQKRLQYINYFNPNYQAVSGPHKALYPFVQNLGLIYAVTEEQTGDYLVDHSASVALVDPHGKIRAIFKPEFKAGSVPTINTDAMIEDLKSILSYYGS
ncbi:SCO family protein [Pseudoalteromonas ruthenica]|uniref:SCO family protein n=1 Tax=Pseudoalteromonas ruthenica TaxID=151081 RepID=UPI001107CC26|nr:SCO family protein [Pseudoalteromonas ruthenica]TLX52248.1 SCO family protein [Pseudoalteromonas ruthenica]